MNEEARTIQIDANTASAALSLAYSRMGQQDAQGDQARMVARVLYAAIGEVEEDDNQ